MRIMKNGHRFTVLGFSSVNKGESCPTCNHEFDSINRPLAYIICKHRTCLECIKNSDAKCKICHAHTFSENGCNNGPSSSATAATASDAELPHPPPRLVQANQELEPPTPLQNNATQPRVVIERLILSEFDLSLIKNEPIEDENESTGNIGQQQTGESNEESGIQISAIPSSSQSNIAWCPSCQVNLKNHHGLVIHNVRVHKHLRPHICTICNYAVATKKGLRIHILQMHKKEDEVVKVTPSQRRTQGPITRQLSRQLAREQG